MTSLGIVAIGRNEGERLVTCLESAKGHATQVVYVDSGSTDGSVESARSLGAEVVELDLSIPFTAARARNAGVARLLELVPDAQFVQFIDGDCELVDGWIEQGLAAFAMHPDVAVVCGRLRERHPGASLFNRLADLEWDTPLGELKSCGGISLMRIGPFLNVGGFDPSLIAGEEPELCVRLRSRGWKILRIDGEMALHDVAMTRLGQWWKRTVRAGYGDAEGATMHGAPPERHRVKELRSALVWGLAIPGIILGLAWPTCGLSLVLAMGYLYLGYRIVRHGRSRGWSDGDARLYATHCVAAKFPQAIGAVRYHLGRLVGRRSGLIEYKRPPRPFGNRPPRVVEAIVSAEIGSSHTS